MLTDDLLIGTTPFRTTSSSSHKFDLFHFSPETIKRSRQCFAVCAT